MEIQALRLSVNEETLNRLVASHIPKDVPVEKLVVRLTPEGIRVQGEYPTVFMKVGFESLWALSVSAGRLEVRLAEVKVSGFPATMLRGVIFKVLKESVSREPGLTIDQETLQIDIEQFLAGKDIPLKVNLRKVECAAGAMTIEAGSQAAV